MRETQCERREGKEKDNNEGQQDEHGQYDNADERVDASCFQPRSLQDPYTLSAKILGASEPPSLEAIRRRHLKKLMENSLCPSQT